MPGFPAARRILLPARSDANQGEHLEPPITLSVHDAGEGPAVVFCHGFPELAYSWRHQFEPLVEAGFRVIAPDMRGYGASDAPSGIETYDIFHLTGDLVGLLDALEIDQAVFVGHDWGGFVAWAMPILHPERTAGVIGVNTPYLPRGPIAPTKMMEAAAGGHPEKIYILWFQQPGVAEGVLDANPRIAFEKLMRRPPSAEEMQEMMASADFDMNPFRRFEEIEPKGEALLSDAELDVFIDAFERTGFRGGVSWYRNFDRNWELAPEVGTEKIDKPSLMVTAENDFILSPATAAGMPALVDDLETIMIEQCGHWTQQERPQELNEILVDWLSRRFK